MNIDLQALAGRGTLVAMLGANIIPLFGVLLLEWTAFQVILLYWMETAIIAFYALLKIGLNGDPPLATAFYATLFTMLWGGFMYGHLILLIALTKTFTPPGTIPGTASLIEAARSLAPDTTTTGIWLAVLSISHGTAFLQDILNGRHTTTLETVTRTTGRRITTVHIALLGMLWILLLVNPAHTTLLLFLIAVKIGIDARTHFHT